MNLPSSTETCLERLARITADLAPLKDPQERLAWLMRRAPTRPVILDACRRRDECLVPGCASRFWLDCRHEDGRCRFSCDSDSAILRSLGALLCECYDDLAPEEVFQGEPEFLRAMGILNLLTENRRRTVQRLREVIRGFAKAAIH
jgi:cysteine desulfuration protein SufE